MALFKHFSKHCKHMGHEMQSTKIVAGFSRDAPELTQNLHDSNDELCCLKGIHAPVLSVVSQGVGLRIFAQVAPTFA